MGERQQQETRIYSKGGQPARTACTRQRDLQGETKASVYGLFPYLLETSRETRDVAADEKPEPQSALDRPNQDRF